MENTSQHQFETRKYQVDLIKRIKQMNAILFLPTGSGKTYIALETIKCMQKDLQKPVSLGGKRTIFLVNTVALAEQHYSFLKEHCSLSIKMLTGESGADQMDKEDWSKIVDDFQILLMTCQVYVNALTHADLSLKNANLIIFDECHHAVNKHPMREVMDVFKDCDKKDHPKVLGLTATLINGNTSLVKFNEELEILQDTFRSKIITSSRVAEVQKFSTKAKEIHLQTVPYESPTEITDKIKDLVEKHNKILENMKLKNGKSSKANYILINNRGENRVKLLKNCLSDVMVHLEEYGLYFSYKICESYILQLERIISDKIYENNYYNALLVLRTLLGVIRKLIVDEISRSGNIGSTETIIRYCPQKFYYLMKQLINFSPTDKCIIFVERRMTANILSKVIKIFFKEINSQAVVDFMIGSSPHPLRNFKEEINDRKRNKEIMAKFRSGKINILVASNVLEEGIDMPDCNVVFMYDFPKTYRSYVQSKGRARDENSSYVLFIDSDTEMGEKIEHFRELEKKLKEVVPLFDISDVLEYEKPHGRENNEKVYTTLEGARITKSQAVPIINKYCSTLPHDKFTRSVPEYHLSKAWDGYYCHLKLPTNAAIKKVVKGPVCKNTKEAKEAVAFEVIKRLHELNALDDSLKPVLAPQREDKEWFPHWQNENPGDGTKSSKKEICIKVSKYLENSRPVADQTCYLHVINIAAKYPLPTTHRRQKCGELLTSRNELGILTRNEIPQVCNFPVFSDLGEIEISIDTNYHSLELSENELLALSKFHRILFQQTIQVVNKFLIYSEDPDEPMGYYIVPLKPSTYRNLMEIDFEVISKQNAIFDEEKLSENACVENYNNYQDCVVLPGYLKHHNKETEGRKKYYVITNVDENKTMHSSFPGKKYASFVEYFDKHHGIKCQKPNQPLLEARQIPHKLNFLRPRGKSETKGENDIYLPAELCIKLSMPGVYWYKSTILPTVLHRLHYLLLAEEVREKLANVGDSCILKWNEGDNRDVLEVYEKYDCRKSLNIEQAVGLKNGSSYKSKTSKKPEKCEVPRNEFFHVNYFSGPPPLMTLEKRTDYVGPSQKDIIAALTPRECNDIMDLERLETLGDSFLKFAVSFTIFVKHPRENEGYMTALKSKLVGNQNLSYCGHNMNLGSFIKVNTFSPTANWCPPGFALPLILKEIRSITDPSVIFHMKIPSAEQFSGIISSKTISNMKDDVKKFVSDVPNKSGSQNEKDALMFYGKQSVSDKTIADVVEALVGAYVKTGGIKPAYRLLTYFGIISKSTYDEAMGSRVPPPIFEESKLTIDNFKELEKQLSYKFRNKSYIVQALSHPSNPKNTNYQILEFVGDAVLDFLITSYIFEYCGDLPPGKITDLRASLVNNNTFGALSIRLGFHKFLLSDNERLTDSIHSFEYYQRRNKFKIHGNDMMDEIFNGNIKMAEEVEVPKVLGDIFESLAGAIFLDSGNDFHEVWRVYYSMMEEEIKKFSKRIPINPIRALYEEPNLTVKFTKNETSQKKIDNGKMVVKLIVTKNKKTLEYYGIGENSDLCKRAAAKLALKNLKRTEFFI